MVKVRFIGDQAFRESRGLVRGDELDVTEAEAEDLLASGRFEKVATPPPGRPVKEARNDLGA